jgi:hypothetical protein
LFRGIEKIKEGMSDKLATVVQSIACMISGIVIGATMRLGKIKNL